MRRAIQFLSLVLACVGVGCTTGQTTPPPIKQVNVADPNYSKVQFAVGTANIYGLFTGLNVVSTLRQPNGTSAVGADTPTITGPFVNTNAAVAAAGASFGDPYTTLFAGGPSLPEKSSASAIILGTPQTVHPGTPFCDTVGAPPAGFTQCPPGIPPNTSSFGQSGGVFAMGLGPYNVVANTANAYSYAPYPQPLYDNGTTHPNFVPWGGPPAFDPDGNGMGTRDGLIILGSDSLGFNYFLGVGEGVTVFENVTPVAGTYTLAVQISFVVSGGGQQSVTFTQTAPLSVTTLLPTLTAPLVTPDASGGASIAGGALPGGVTEELVQIVDYGPGGSPSAGTTANCHGAKGTSFAPVYYTVVARGAASYALGSLHGPNNLAGGPGTLTPTPSICTAAQNGATVGTATGDNITVQVFGFDYPDYEAAFSLTQPSTPQAPAIAGPGGQSDITISQMVEEDWPAYTPTPLAVTRHPFILHGRHAGTAPVGPADMFRKLGVPLPFARLP